MNNNDILNACLLHEKYDLTESIPCIQTDFLVCHSKPIFKVAQCTIEERNIFSYEQKIHFVTLLNILAESNYELYLCKAIHIIQIGDCMPLYHVKIVNITLEDATDRPT